MKKIIKTVVILLFLTFCVPVFAETHVTGELIPIGEVSTVDTEMFTYTNISYATKVEGKEYGRFYFESITNKLDKSAPVSINILLFDAERKNIGFVTYCTGEDVESDYAQMKLQGGASTPFSINVSSRYYVTDKSTEDVSYYAVLDENEYCHVGGYDKYEGLTIEEIISGVVVTDEGEKDTVQVETLISSISIIVILAIFAGVIVVFVVQGLILNALYKRMYATTTPLAYLPIACSYVTVKMAFGKRIGMIFLISYFVSFALSFVGLGLFNAIVSIVAGAAFVVDIIKLITKRYDLCYLEPFENNKNVAVGGKFTLNNNIENVQDTGAVQVGGPVQAPMDDGLGPAPAGEDVLDLNYNSATPTGGFTDTDTSNNHFSYDASDSENFTSTTDADVNDTPQNISNEDNNGGNSDLMNLFK